MNFFPAYGISVALSVKDYENRPVVWSETNFTRHLMTYPDRNYLPRYINVIETTIQEPYKIGEKDGNTILYSHGFIDQDITDNTLYMKVVIAYNSYPAHVRTAFLTTDTRGATIVYSG